MTKKPQTVYIDGDLLPYTVGFATQRTIYRLDKVGEHHCSPAFVIKGKRGVNAILKEDPEFEVHDQFFTESPIQAIETLKLMITNIVQHSKCDWFKVVISGDSNFRERVATIQKYKGNRDDMEKPVHWQLLRDWLAKMPYTIIAEDEEADDVVSRAMVQGHMGATIDKDLDNTPGWHFNFRKGNIYYVDEDQANRNFYRQLLTGDRDDNIPGIKGIGPVKAAAAVTDDLTSPADMERAVVPHYEKQYGEGWLKAMQEVGQLLWMRREEDEVWHPIAIYDQ